MAKTHKMADKVEICGNLSARINGTDSQYLDTLDPEDRKRFREKLKVPVAGVFVNIFAIPTRCGTKIIYTVWNDKPTLLLDVFNLMVTVELGL